MAVGRRILRSAWSTTSNFATIGGFVLVLISFFVVPATAQFSAAWSLTIGTFLVWLIIVLGRMILDAMDHLDETTVQLQAARAAQGSPKVIQGFPSPRFYQHESKCMLLVDPTWDLSVESLVAVYQVEGNVEQFVAVGIVANIQADRRVQIVLLDDPHNGQQLADVARNDQNVLDKLIIKPSVPKHIYRLAQNA